METLVWRCWKPSGQMCTTMSSKITSMASDFPWAVRTTYSRTMSSAILPSEWLVGNSFKEQNVYRGCYEGDFSEWMQVAYSASSRNRYNFFTYLGSDAPDVVASGRSQDNKFISNFVRGGLETIKLKESDGTTFQDNEFVDAITIRFDNATEMRILGNKGLDDAELKVVNGACFDNDSDDRYTPNCWCSMPLTIVDNLGRFDHNGAENLAFGTWIALPLTRAWNSAMTICIREPLLQVQLYGVTVL